MLQSAQRSPWSAENNQLCHLLLMQILPKTSSGQLGSVILTLSHVKCKRRMADLVLQYEDVFSRDHLDCGKAKDFAHRIHLSDSRTFRLPYPLPRAPWPVSTFLRKRKSSETLEIFASVQTFAELWCLCGKKWRSSHLYRLSLVEQKDPKGRPSPSSPGRFFGSAGRQQPLQHNGSDLRVLQHAAPQGRQEVLRLHHSHGLV